MLVLCECTCHCIQLFVKAGRGEERMVRGGDGRSVEKAGRGGMVG